MFLMGNKGKNISPNGSVLPPSIVEYYYRARFQVVDIIPYRAGFCICGTV